MKTIKHFIFGSLMVLAATSCIDRFVIEGNGVVNSEERGLVSFSKVKSSGNFEVYITKATSPGVVVEAEQTIIPYIETKVSGNTLYIDIPGWNTVINHRPMKIFVTTPVLNGMQLSGSGLLDAEFFETGTMELFVSGSGTISADVSADLVDARVSGSGNITISGDAGETRFNISGSGNIYANNLASEKCQAFISGSGNMRVFADETLRADISGSGNVYYKGNPAVDSHVSGSGKVIREN
jgi:hypothetical protein